MTVPISLINNVGVLSAFNQSAESFVEAAVASISTSRTSNASENIVNQINQQIRKKEEEIDFFLDRLITIDGEKIEVDTSIKKMDQSILDEIESVNNKLRDLKTSHENAINAGVKSNLFWRIVDDGTTYTYGSGFSSTSTRTVKLKCVKTSPNGYPPVVVGITQYSFFQLLSNLLNGTPLPPLDNGKTMQHITPSGIGKISINAFPPFGYTYDNLYGIKYYDHPYAVDVLDTYVGSFPGSISIGSTVLAINQLLDSGVADRIKVGQNLICSKDNVFVGGNEITGIGTTSINLDYTIQKIQATAVSSISTTGVVTSISVSNPGLGYTDSPVLPAVYIQPPSGNVAVGTAIVSAAGTISSIQLSNPGSGYTTAPNVTISAPFTRSAVGLGLTGSAGIITSVVIIDGGFSYSSAPTVLFANPPVIGVGIGTTATGTANISAGVVTSVTITNPGYGYTSSPNVEFSNPGFTTATADAFISSAGIVTSIKITNPGSAYTTDSEFSPVVFFSSPLVVGASATTTVSIAGTILSVNIVNSGLGYTSPPSVSIQSPYNDVVPILYLETAASDSASYPEDDASIVTFTVLSSSEDIVSIAATTIAISFGLNPYSPENIGIMKTNQTGIGVSIKYDNSGYADGVYTWRPELEGDAVVIGGQVVYPAIKEPIVGSGKIYYNVAFTYKPRYPTNSSYTTWRDAVEGDTLTVQYKSGYGAYNYNNPPILSSFVTSCDPDTGGYFAAITDAQNEVNTAKSQISAGISVLNNKITVSNILRKRRNEYNIQIWGNRQLIGQLLSEIDEYENSKTILGDPTIAEIIS